jgi:ABC-type glutathione transport system ATPase component
MMRRSARVHGHADPTAAAAEALAAVGLAGRAQAWGRHLSGGEARRVGVARLRLGRPRLIFADEPTGGIDAAQRHGLLALLLLPVAGPPPALLLVSHDLPLVARWCERVLVLQDGKVVEELAGPALAGGGQAEETRRLVRAVPAWKTDGAST